MLLALASVVTAGVVVPTPAGAVTEDAPRRVIHWQPCAQDPTADCGTLTLPVDWARPHGSTFELALARRRATDPGHRIGSLVLDFGGPGNGVDEVIGSRHRNYFSAEIDARFDRVAFDPRGWNASAAPNCPAGGPRPAADPTTPAGFAAIVADNRQLIDSCRRRSGPMYDHMDSLSVARDLDAIRAALGDRKLSFWGSSYGTLMGQQYAELFPGRFRALALESNMDHSRAVGSFLETATATIEASFGEFAKWCAGDPSCALYGRDVGSVFDELYARAVAGTLYDPDDPSIGITTMALLDETQADFKNPLWRGRARRLAALAAELPRATPPAPTSTESRIRNAQAVFCADWRLDFADADELAALDRRLAVIAPHMRRSFNSWYAMTLCLGRSAGAVNPQRPYRVHGSTPILLTGNVYDSNTPYVWTTAAAERIPGAVVLTYEGVGHGAYGRSPCAAAVADRYLVDLRTPPPGTRCPAVPPRADG
ncbi:alpha/beta hydrolase [Embleya sp. AB8]|uniref:alpha/beta hydrolase n=1 Tax=Embleya sp. AB8 TaxID=3156304 RepID=UPI003C71A9C6